MFRLYLIVTIFLSSITVAQTTCNISVSNDTSVCGGSSFGIAVTGELHDLRWSPPEGLSDVTIANPIVNIQNSTTYIVTNKHTTGNLITNGNFDAGSNGFTNDYVVDCPNTPYGPDIGTWMEGAPNDGQYCVAPSTSFAFALGGWQACSDHTGNNGNIMYVNGDITPSAKIWCQNVNVTPNTDYQFSTWITSVYNGNPAQLAFSINGSVLGSPFTAKQNTCEWTEFYEVWGSGINTTANICIVNQNTVSNGNDFALDDITFQKACIARDTVEITVNPEPKVDLGIDQSICPGDSVDINSGFPITNEHLWNTGASTNSISTDNPGTFHVQVKDDNGCIGGDTIVILEVDTPFAFLPMDTTICFYLTQNFELKARDQAVNYNWSTGSTEQAILIDRPGTYHVNLNNTSTCASSDTITIEESCDASFLFIPNAFTPNGDGTNEYFDVKGENVYVYKIDIYNRWGEFLFTSNNINIDWDGRYMNQDAPTGVYVYKVTFEGISPLTNKANSEIRFGHINLIR